MSDSIHKTHFQVPEMPHKRKEQEATLLLQKFLRELILSDDFFTRQMLRTIIEENKDLVDWVMKYKGE